MATANHVLLRRITVTSAISSVTFDSIPQTGYTDLKIVASARTNRADVTDGLNITFNSGGTYTGKRLYGSGSGVASDSSTTGMPFMDSASATANTFGNVEIYIPNYTSSNAKTLSVDGVSENNATAAYAGLGAKLWSSTAAVTSVTIAPEVGSAIVAGSSFSLYGLADVNTTPASAPKADGGDIIKTDGTYWYHAFTSSGSFKPQVNLSCDVLVVAGGGGGADNIGGGGAAGGLRYLASQALSNIAYTATIGAGGTGGPGGGGQLNGTKGGNSSFAGGLLTTITATGGGYGAIGDVNGGDGGSGGGTRGTVGNGGTGNQGSYTPVEGYNGGKGNTSTTAGGGGGASAVGQTAPSSSQSGAGGAGVNTYSSWATTTGTGSSGYYAGGGAGGGYPAASVTAGTGGAGGGGNGGSGSTPGTSGVANTGSGGGGGSSAAGTQYPGGNGGSGIIILRYAV